MHWKIAYLYTEENVHMKEVPRAAEQANGARPCRVKTCSKFSQIRNHLQKSRQDWFVHEGRSTLSSIDQHPQV